MYIKVRVTTGVKKEEIIEKSHDHFEVSVREKAERNLANRRVVEIMAGRFGVLPNKVRIINGHHSPSKILSVDIPEK